jgi:catechol 2,3-dioxygenase-like lactoylglutathione lyase family enzyme
MFRPKSVAATLPAQDFERAKAFYAERLGLRPVRENPGEGCMT